MSEPVTETPVVRVLNQRQHLPTVLELEAAASADRRRLYEGVAWTAGGFRDYLRGGMKGGRGIVAVNKHGTVVGFAVFAPAVNVLYVPKLVTQSRAAEDVLLKALWEICTELGKSILHLPIVLDLQ